METKLKHLEFIQSAINRMANNSFLLKGWAVTLVGALFALTFKEMDKTYLVVSLIVMIFMWLLDCFYLRQERAYIGLYDQVRKANIETDFSMNAKLHRDQVHWYSCAFSFTLAAFYGGLLLAHVLIFTLIPRIC